MNMAIIFPLQTVQISCRYGNNKGISVVREKLSCDFRLRFVVGATFLMQTLRTKPEMHIARLRSSFSVYLKQF
jgi:hypothetical protein